MNRSRGSLLPRVCLVFACLGFVACGGGDNRKRDAFPSGNMDAAVNPDTPGPTPIPRDMAAPLPDVVPGMDARPDGGTDGGGGDAPDGAMPVDMMAREVAPPAANEWRVAGGTDDGEEYVIDDGVMMTMGTDLTSSDLEITRDIPNMRNQTIGLRFAGVTVPQGARVTAAWIQFVSRIQTDANMTETAPADTNYTIHGEAADNPTTFITTRANDITLRTKTTASVPWSMVPMWGTAAEASGPDQRTPSLVSVVQELVDRPGWASGNAMVFIIGGMGTRSARSYQDSAPEKAPTLHVEFGAAPDGGTGDAPPPADATPSDTAPADTAAADSAPADTSAGDTAADDAAGGG